jgi:hypothetical protein
VDVEGLVTVEKDRLIRTKVACSLVAYSYEPRVAKVFVSKPIAEIIDTGLVLRTPELWLEFRR